MPRDRAAHTACRLVAASVSARRRGRGQRSTSAVESSGRPAGLACDVVDERVDERWLDVESARSPAPRSRVAARPAHRAEQHVVGADEVGQLGVRGEPAEEIRAQREQTRRALGVPGRVDEHVDERPPLVLRYGRGEELLELVDREDEPLTGYGRARGPAALAATARRARLRAIARADDQCMSQAELGSSPARSSEDLPIPTGRLIASSGACRAGRELIDEPLAAEEELARQPRSKAPGP